MEITNAPSAPVPKAIRDAIYKKCCACGLTEDQAKREPCGCSAHAIINDIEDWVDDLRTNSSGTMILDDDSLPTEADMNDIIASMTADDDGGAEFLALCDASTKFPDGLTVAEFAAACKKWLASRD